MRAPAAGSGEASGRLENERTSLAAYYAAELRLLEAADPAFLTSIVDDRPTVSVGVGVPENAAWLSGARAAGLPVIRRHTGGTGLVHLRGDLLWSLVLPRSDPRIGTRFVRAYGALGAPVVEALRDVAISASWEEPPGISEEYCTLGRRGRVLSSEGRILGGAAQHATARALLHHGTVSWTLDRTLLVRVFGPPVESALPRLGSASERLGPLEPTRLLERVHAHLDRFTAPPAPGAG